MNCIYTHDEEEDFVEIQLSELELKNLLFHEMVEKSYPAMLHGRRSTSILIRRA